ncbi:MAG: YkgJ family cysteine cluster protein [Desulfobacterales bacterium]|nr:YkgJ family cysteine cluster protein [Desulfobacterales bacterium]
MFPQLQNYKNLVAKVDAMCLKVSKAYHSHIKCRKGCDGCCRQISIFPVEAFALLEGLLTLPKNEMARIRKKIETIIEDGSCPLLEDEVCLLYGYRPIICRTHGMPIRIMQNGESKLDFCPMNFQKHSSISVKLTIDLEKLNEALSTINALFIKESKLEDMPERVTVSEALLYLDFEYE